MEDRALLARIRKEESELRPGDSCLRHDYIEMNLLLPNGKRAQECVREELNSIFAERPRWLGECPLCGFEGLERTH